MPSGRGHAGSGLGAHRGAHRATVAGKFLMNGGLMGTFIGLIGWKIEVLIGKLIVMSFFHEGSKYLKLERIENESCFWVDQFERIGDKFLVPSHLPLA